MLTVLHNTPGPSLGLVADVSKAHRRHKHRPRDWGLMACQLDDPDTVGTFGLGCASYWWGRLFAILARCALGLVGRAELWQLLFADDLNWLAKGIPGIRALVFALFLLSAMGTPSRGRK